MCESITCCTSTSIFKKNIQYNIHYNIRYWVGLLLWINCFSDDNTYFQIIVTTILSSFYLNVAPTNKTDHQMFTSMGDKTGAISLSGAEIISVPSILSYPSLILNMYGTDINSVSKIGAICEPGLLTFRSYPYYPRFFFLGIYVLFILSFLYYFFSVSLSSTCEFNYYPLCIFHISGHIALVIVLGC